VLLAFGVAATKNRLKLFQRWLTDTEDVVEVYGN